MTERPGSQSLTALIAKRAELAGEVTRLRADLRQAHIDLEHIDAAIRIFDPEFDVEGIKPKGPPALYNISFRGEFVRIVLDMMRQAKGPVTTKEIATHIMQGRGLNAEDPALLALFMRRTRGLLYHYRSRGMIRGVAGNDPGKRKFNWWEIAV